MQVTVRMYQITKLLMRSKIVSLLKRVEPCAGCEGSLHQVNEYGFVRKCPCSTDFKTFSNLYGSDKDVQAEFYIDMEKGHFSKITEKDNKAGGLILKDGTIIQFNN